MKTVYLSSLTVLLISSASALADVDFTCRGDCIAAATRSVTAPSAAAMEGVSLAAAIDQNSALGRCSKVSEPPTNKPGVNWN